MMSSQNILALEIFLSHDLILKVILTHHSLFDDILVDYNQDHRTRITIEKTKRETQARQNCCENSLKILT